MRRIARLRLAALVLTAALGVAASAGAAPGALLDYDYDGAADNVVAMQADFVAPTTPAASLRPDAVDARTGLRTSRKVVHLVSGSRVAAKTGTEVRRVGDVLGTPYDALANPKLLAGKSPQEVVMAVRGAPGWRIETLGKGSHKGQGLVLRQYTDAGNPTGSMIRWHPGGGHHGPDPYWCVINSRTGFKSGEIR